MLAGFPIDGAVDKIMAAKGATPLTADQVKVTLRDDPGRGWIVKDGLRNTVVMLELPPFHACSVRRFVSRPVDDLSAYRSVVDRFEAGHDGFRTLPPRDLERGDIHVHSSGDARILPGGTSETFFLIEQTTNDPAKKAAGDMSVEYRLVHQIYAP